MAWGGNDLCVGVFTFGVTSFFRFARVDNHMKRIQHFPASVAAGLLPTSFLFVLAFLVLPGCSGGGTLKSPGGSSVLPYTEMHLSLHFSNTLVLLLISYAAEQ